MSKQITYDFHAYNPDDTSQEVSFTENLTAMNLSKFHAFCKTFAHACGYSTKGIEEVFGKTRFEDFID
jgi:hypothetical protein